MHHLALECMILMGHSTFAMRRMSRLYCHMPLADAENLAVAKNWGQCNGQGHKKQHAPIHKIIVVP